LLNEAAAIAQGTTDSTWGGTPGAPKFSQASFFKFLWRSHLRTGKHTYGDSVKLLLGRMCQGGIYDHLGGGLARHSTDDFWLARHFEKMLYDNAQLLELMTDVWRTTKNPLLATRIEETIQWCLNEMTLRLEGDEGFAFASALDADSEGKEGLFYVWNEDEVDQILKDDSRHFKDVYNITPGGNWEGSTILNRNASDDTRKPFIATKESQLKENRQALLKVRNKRIRPERNDKSLVDWNAMMISALANVGALLEHEDWIETGKTVFAFACRNMVEKGRLRHSWRDGKLRHSAVLDDYAHMMCASLNLLEATGNNIYLDQAEAWMATVQAYYADEKGGGYFLSADDANNLIIRSKTIVDNMVPSGNGVMAEYLARLYLLTGKEEYHEREI
jgi:uncharacterized protein YyaL (SSP411 family)